MPRHPKDAAVAASSEWTDPDGFRSPAGSVHAWLRGTNQTRAGSSSAGPGCSVSRTSSGSTYNQPPAGTPIE